MEELFRLTAHELHDKLLAKEVSSVELTRAVLSRIEALEPHVRAYLQVDTAGALKAAAEADAALRAGEAIGPFTGIPMAIKANISTSGWNSNAGSRILEPYRAPYDATVVARLRAQKAVPLGTTNMDEFGMGSSTENSGYQVTHNPWNLDYVPGGTSGGSAAAVAADEAIVALGSDTGGSIRQPASFCGVVGFKPTYGMLSRYGLIAYASSLDTIGVIGKDVHDAASLMTAVSGHDPQDSTMHNRPMPDLVRHLDASANGLRIGVPKEYFGEGVSASVQEVVRGAIETLTRAGADCVDVSVPLTKFAIPAYYLVAMSEASSNLARYDGMKYGLRETRNDVETTMDATRQAGFGAEVRRRIIMGTFALSAGYEKEFYLQAQKVRTLIIEDYRKAFEQCDMLISPASPFPAFRIGEKTGDPLTMYLADVHTVIANLLGIPGLCVPGGFSEDGLPIGIQLQGRQFGEAKLVHAGYALETGLRGRTSRPRIPLDTAPAH